jgi:hypothetical protein
MNILNIQFVLHFRFRHKAAKERGQGSDKASVREPEQGQELVLASDKASVREKALVSDTGSALAAE